ncbi:MAG: hypothetical protein F6K31_07465 [Symploca sp. SIO2G7]|nr:hypothetical protein [Symploca sp. SIO2G7]
MSQYVHRKKNEFANVRRIIRDWKRKQFRPSLQDRITELLRNSPEGLSGGEIKAALGGTDSTYTVLARMVARGVITKRRCEQNYKEKLYFLI